MHDLDRVSMQREGEFEGEHYDSEGEAPRGHIDGAPLAEAEVLELASELLSAPHREELEQVLTEVVSRAGGASNARLHPDTTRAITDSIVPLANDALPLANGGGSNGQRGSSEAFLGLELEGLSREDRELEVAKQLVRLAGTAASIAASAPPHVPPHVVAKTAVSEAAKQFAPGLHRRPHHHRDHGRPDYDDCGFGESPYGGSSMRGPSRHSGRWIRRGNKIILLGV